MRTHRRGAPKIQLDVLRAETSFNTVALPVKSLGTELEGITEESEESDSVAEEGTRIRRVGNIQLNTSEDPDQRFSLEKELFRGKFSVIRFAVDQKAEVWCSLQALLPVGLPLCGQDPPCPVGFHGCTGGVRDSARFSARKRADPHRRLPEVLCVRDQISCRNDFLFLFTEKLYEDVFSRFTFNENYNEEQVVMTTRQMVSALHWIHFRGFGKSPFRHLPASRIST